MIMYTMIMIIIVPLDSSILEVIFHKAYLLQRRVGHKGIGAKDLELLIPIKPV